MGGLKSLLFNDPEGSEDKQEKKPEVKPSTSTKKFPDASPSSETEQSNNSFFNFGADKTSKPVVKPVSSVGVSQETIDKAIANYENGFDGLNQAGYDFYEFFKAVIQIGADNPAIYGMAFTMAKAMDASLSKDKLLQSSDYYINEITNVYNNNVAKGNERKTTLINQKNSENNSLNDELNSMRQQMEALETQIKDRENKISLIDGKYESQINDIEGKLSANEIGKNQIVSKIQQVKNGIINNIN